MTAQTGRRKLTGMQVELLSRLVGGEIDAEKIRQDFYPATILHAHLRGLIHFDGVPGKYFWHITEAGRTALAGDK